MRATIGDVAAMAGVSRQTVSNTINAPEKVKPDTRARVDAAIAELGYRPNLNARRLRTASPRSVALRITESQNGFHSGLLDRFVHSITAEAKRNDLHVLVFTAEDHDSEIREITELAALGLADAFVISGTSYEDPRVAELVRAGHNFVAFGRPWGEDLFTHKWVDVDGFDGAREATEACLKVAKRVAFVGWPEGSGVGDERRNGWRTALIEAERTDILDLQVTIQDSVQGAYLEADALLDAGADAFVCASDSLAFGIVQKLWERSLQLPVVGFDDSFMSEHIGYASVNQNIREVATKVVDLLDVDSKDDSVPELSALITPRLIPRSNRRWGIPEHGPGTSEGKEKL